MTGIPGQGWADPGGLQVTDSMVPGTPCFAVALGLIEQAFADVTKEDA